MRYQLNTGVFQSVNLDTARLGNISWGTGCLSAYESSTNDYSSPPETSHIEWTTPMEGFAGGVAGNTEAGQGAALNNGGDNYYTGMSYQTQFGTAIIMNGQLYYNVGGIPSEGFVDLNLQTGQQVYYQNGTLGNHKNFSPAKL